MNWRCGEKWNSLGIHKTFGNIILQYDLQLPKHFKQTKYRNDVRSLQFPARLTAFITSNRMTSNTKMEATCFSGMILTTLPARPHGVTYQTDRRLSTSRRQNLGTSMNKWLQKLAVNSKPPNSYSVLLQFTQPINVLFILSFTAVPSHPASHACQPNYTHTSSLLHGI